MNICTANTIDFLDNLKNECGGVPTAPNHASLVALAQRLEDLFELPMPHMPGASFVGGKVKPDPFGISGFDDATIGVAGRGLDRVKAFESCIGEAAELLAFMEHDSEPLLVAHDKRKQLAPAEMHWSLDGAGLERTSDPKRMDWVNAISLSRGDAVQFPADLVLRRPVGRRDGTRPAESTGVAAGATWRDALTAALLEVIERDAYALWWYGGAPARRFSPQVLEHTSVRQFVDAYRDCRERFFWLMDLTTEFGVPVAAALSAEPDGGAVVGGFCAHTDAGIAIRGALLELGQMELAQSLSRMKQAHGNIPLQPQDKVWLERHEMLSIDDNPALQLTLQPLASCTDRLIDLDQVIARLDANGFRVFAVDLTREGLEIPAARVLVPGLQSARPDWRSRRLAATASRYRRTLDDVSSAVSPL